VTNQSLPGGVEPNIIPIRTLSKLLDPLFLDAHRLVDQVPRDRLIGLIPLLRRAVPGSLAGIGLLKPVEEKILSSAARMEPPTPGPVAVSGRS